MPYLHQGAPGPPVTGETFVRGTGRWKERLSGRVPGQPETGAKQEQGDEGKPQEVSGRGQKTGGDRCITTSQKKIC